MSHDEQDCEICPRGSHEIESPTKEPYTGHKCIEYAKFGNCEHVSTKESPAVEGWESGFDAIWVRGQHDTTPYHLCKDFIRSQITKAFERGRYQKLKDMGLEDEITKAKEEERRVVVGEVQNLLKEEKWGYHTMGDDTRKAFDLEELNKMCLASNNNTIDSIQSRLSSLLPTGDNKQI